MTDFLTHPLLSAHHAIGHGFFTRQGGVSDGIYHSLNCGLGTADDPAKVAQNRNAVLGALSAPTAQLVTLYQIHSNHCFTLRDASQLPDWQKDRGDALVTNLSGMVLGVLTADCAPILFYDPIARVIGAAHAGWRGAMNGILASTVRAMGELGSKPSNIIAVIGPCIAQASYQVDAAYRQGFITQNPAHEAFFRPSPRAQHYQFDLPGYVLAQLLSLRLAAIDHLPYDTCADPTRFYSYRRTTLAGGGDYGRQISAIVLR
jgi:YfiH family protein